MGMAEQDNLYKLPYCIVVHCWHIFVYGVSDSYVQKGEKE